MIYQEKAHFFGESRTASTGRAPGTLTVLGGPAGFAGGMILTWPLGAHAQAEIAPRQDGMIQIYARYPEGPEYLRMPIIPLLRRAGSLQALDLPRLIKENAGAVSNLPVVATVTHLIRKGLLSAQGWDIWIEHMLPRGKGTGSLSALIMAILQAAHQGRQQPQTASQILEEAQRISLALLDRRAHQAEQFNAYLGKERHILPVFINPRESFPGQPISRPLSWSAMSLGIQMPETTRLFTNLQVSTWIGYSLLARQQHVTWEQLKLARESGQHSPLPFRGLPAQIPLRIWENSLSEQVPERITGADFLQKGLYILDQDLHPHEIYQPRKAIDLCIRTHTLSNRFLQLNGEFQQEPSIGLAREMGLVLDDSHKVTMQYGFSHPVAEQLLQQLRLAGPDKGILGARLTMGGTGSTIGVLSWDQAGQDHALRIFQSFERTHQIKGYFLGGSSDGALYG